MVQLVSGRERKVDVTGVHVKYHGLPMAAAEIPKESSRQFEEKGYVRQALTNPEIMDVARTPFLGALFRYTAEMNARNREFERSAIHRDHEPVMSISRHIKACSLFPNIYAPAAHHRTFPKMEVENAMGSRTGMMKKRKGGEAVQASSNDF